MAAGDPPRVSPKDAHRLVVVVEHCTAQRPSTNLKGSSEKYVAVCKKLGGVRGRVQRNGHRPRSTAVGGARREVLNADDACACLPTSRGTRIATSPRQRVFDVPPTNPCPVARRGGELRRHRRRRPGGVRPSSRLVSGTWPNLDQLMARFDKACSTPALATARRRRRGGERAGARGRGRRVRARRPRVGARGAAAAAPGICRWVSAFCGSRSGRGDGGRARRASRRRWPRRRWRSRTPGRAARVGVRVRGSKLAPRAAALAEGKRRWRRSESVRSSSMKPAAPSSARRARRIRGRRPRRTEDAELPLAERRLRAVDAAETAAEAAKKAAGGARSPRAAGAVRAAWRRSTTPLREATRVVGSSRPDRGGAGGGGAADSDARCVRRRRWACGASPRSPG